METADVVIIGGGVIGTSIAYHVANKFKKVVLLEQGAIGAQTSGSCDKAIFLQSKKPGFPIKLAKMSRKIYENLEEELGIPFEFKKAGGMIVIESEEHMAFMKGFVESQRKAGIDVKLLDKQEALERQPCFSQGIIGSTYCSEDAEVNPLLLSQAFAKSSKRKGVDIRTHTGVTDILIEHGHVIGVKTAKGEIATERVVNAAGPFSPSIAKMAGTELPIEPRRGVILISEKVEPVVHGNILCSHYIAAKHLVKKGEDDMPQYGVGLSLGQTDSGNLLIGGSREFKGFSKVVESEVISTIADHARKVVPFLNGIRIIRTMAGFRPYTGDGLPIIDEVQGMKGFFIAAGHEGDGIALAPVTGKLVASLLAGESRYETMLEPLKLERLKVH